MQAFRERFNCGYDVPRGCIEGDYTEMNVVMSHRDYARKSGSPFYKEVPVKLKRED
ncbi:hypothetical protein SB748_27305 [Rhizobium sp. SIMBA_035]